MEKMVIINYLYQYAITFCICLLGSFVKDAYDTTINKTPISIKKIIISTLFTSFAMCAVYDLLTMNFAGYVFLSFFCGMWGFSLVKRSMNYKYIFILIKNILSQVSQPVCKGISKGMQEIEDDKLIEISKSKNNDNQDEKKNPEE